MSARQEIKSIPKVSVVIPAYNCARFLEDAVKSVLAQKYENFELIIIDDGSTDETVEVISRFSGPVRCIRQQNQGRAQARNVGLRNATGVYIAFLDADDIWEPDHLARSVQFLETHPSIGLVHGEVKAIDADGQELVHKSLLRIYRQERKRRGDYFSLLFCYAIFSSAVVFRRVCLERTGFFDPAFQICEDYEWYLRFSLYSQIGLMEKPSTAKYRLHSGNVVSQYDPKTIAKTYVAILGKHLQLIDEKYTGENYRKFRSRILMKLAEFQLTDLGKSEARNLLLEALRLDPRVIFNFDLLKRLMLNFF